MENESKKFLIKGLWSWRDSIIFLITLIPTLWVLFKYGLIKILKSLSFNSLYDSYLFLLGFILFGGVFFLFGRILYNIFYGVNISISKEGLKFNNRVLISGMDLKGFTTSGTLVTFYSNVKNPLTGDSFNYEYDFGDHINEALRETKKFYKEIK